MKSSNKANDLDTAFDAWKTAPTPESMDSAIQAAQPVMSSAIKSYVGREDPIAMSHAKLLTAQAFKSYDPSRKVMLRTHLMNQLQPLRRFAASRRFVTKIPERVQYDMTGLREAESELRDKFGRDPTEEELADQAGFSMKRIRHLRGFAVPVAEGVAETSDEARQGAVTTPDPMEDWTRYVYHDLNPIDKKIFEWRTGFNGVQKKGVVEIAKLLGISAGAVTQRANRISKQLEQGMANG